MRYKCKNINIKEIILAFCSYCKSYTRCPKEERSNKIDRFCGNYEVKLCFKHKRNNIVEEPKQSLPVLRRNLIMINADGITKRRTVGGFNSYLRWKSDKGERVYWEDLNRPTQNFLSRKKIFVPSRNGKDRFKKSLFWFIKLYPKSVSEEWDILFSADVNIWERLNSKIKRTHPDRNGGKVKEDFYISLEVRDLFLQRKHNMTRYLLEEKPEYIGI
jgi:hypothetical protein